MKRYAGGTTWVIIVILATVGAVSALAQEKTAASQAETRSASCVVRISYDPSLLPLNGNVIDALLESAGVSAVPARRLLGPQAALGENYSVAFQRTDAGPAGGGKVARGDLSAFAVLVGSIRVEVDGENLRLAAEELLVEVCERLKGALEVLGKADIAQMNEHLSEVERELGLAQQEYAGIRSIQQELLAQAGEAELDRARVENRIRDLQQKRMSIELNLAGAKAREEALTAQIAKIGRDVEAGIKSSPVAVELQRVVDGRIKNLQRMQTLVESGHAPESEMVEAQEAVALAQAQLAQYRESAANEAGGGLLAELNKELIEMSVRTAEEEAQLRHINRQLEEIQAKGLQELADRYEREVLMQLNFNERDVRSLQDELNDLKRRTRSVRSPEIVIIGGKS